MDSNHGSVWRKWDFHVHTPYSILNNNFGFDPFELSGTTLESKFDEYVIKLFTAAVQQEIAAIGITDYFMIEGYKRIKQNYLDCPEKMRQCFPDEALRHAVEQIYVFPNIELRLNNFIGKDAHSVNYHVCFSSDISIQEIEDNFLHRLDFKFDNAPYPLTISNLKLLGNHIKSDNEISGSDIFVGLNHVTVSYTDVLEKLQNNPAFTGKYLIVIPVDEDLPKVSWKGRNYSTRRDLYKQCNCFFTSNRRTIDWALAAGEENSRIHEFGSIKPCIWGSDAHGYDRLFKPDNDNFCWIKADPSFEGLTQILYEPAERVRIQSNCPDVRDVHQLIDSVQFNDSNFQENPIYFNDGLTCIIGGKSTGKSMLLRQLALNIDPSYVSEQEENNPKSKTSFPKVDATVKWKDGTTESRKIVYIPQTYLNRTIDNPEESTAIHNIIANVLLQEPEIKAAYDTLTNTVDTIRQKVQEAVNNLLSEQKHLANLEDLLKRNGSSETYVTTIASMETDRSQLAKTTNITSEEISRFNFLEQELQQLSNKKKNIELELNNYSSLPEPCVIIPGFFSSKDFRNIVHTYASYFPQTEEALSSAMDQANLAIIPIWAQTVEQNVQYLKNIIQHTEEEIQSISVEYNALKNRVAQNQRLQDLTIQITAERTKLQVAKERESDRDQTTQKIANLKKDILGSQAEFHSAYIDFCTVVKSIGTSKNTSLVFDADVVWRQTDFMQYIADTFNNKNFSPFKTANKIDLSDLQPTDYNYTFLAKLIEAWENPDVRGGLALKAGHSNSQALLEIFGDWYNVHYIVRSGNDDIESMSPGKKALVLLEMLISLEDNRCPILIDQPEDDLDNRSIYNDLVKYIREKKKERQFIIVTHNANVVLGADAEEVIIANQDGVGTENSERRFEYRSGSIENDLIPKDRNGIPLSGILNQSGIQTQICDILEGGRTAFQLRQNKYIGIS